MNSSLENSPASPELTKNSKHSQDFQLLSELEHLNAIKFFKNSELSIKTASNPFFHQIQVQYENTYSLEPAKGVPNTDKLRKILKNLISSELSDFSGRYSSFTAKYYCRIVADLIKNEVKDRVDTRYKIITYKMFSKSPTCGSGSVSFFEFIDQNMILILSVKIFRNILRRTFTSA